MQVTVLFCGSEVTGDLVEQTETRTSIRVLEHRKGERKRHAIGVWKSDRYVIIDVENKNVISPKVLKQ